MNVVTIHDKHKISDRGGLKIQKTESPLEKFSKEPLFNDSMPLGNRILHYEKMNQIYLQGNEVGKVIWRNASEQNNFTVYATKEK